jgi:cell division protein FtsN
MPAERKKLLWISISACLFVLVVLAAGFFLLAPKKGGAQAPATIGNSAPPKAQDPHDFLSAPPPVPPLEQPKSQDGGVVIVYGDKPSIPATSEVPAAQAAPGGAPSTSTPSTASPAPTAAPEKPTQAAPAKPKATTVPAAKKVSANQATVKVDEYWIQASSFSNRGRADELKAGLAEKGIAALISVKDISGKSWYRVRIGPYAGKAEAEGWLGRLKAIPGCAEAYVSKTIATKAKR